jgi:transcriptional regulator with GAF, ATPase, and Fis domain
MRWDLATRYQILLDINNAVITETSKDKFFSTLLAELKKHFAFDGATILLYDEKINYLNLFASSGANVEEVLYLKQRPLSTGALAKKVILSRKPLMIEDLKPYQHEFPVGELLKLGITATIAFPLIVHDRVTGSLHLLFKNPPEYMTELFEFLTHVSKQVAIAVDVFLSYAKVKEVNFMLEEEKKFLLTQSGDYADGDLIYASAVMKHVIATTRQAANTDASILITGETGTGKDKIARYIHDLSPRKNHLFVKVNCPAIAETLFESELFGHSKGAFTGATAKRMGRIEMFHF